jgi:hypothetical protein
MVGHHSDLLPGCGTHDIARGRGGSGGDTGHTSWGLVLLLVPCRLQRGFDHWAGLQQCGGSPPGSRRRGAHLHRHTGSSSWQTPLRGAQQQQGGGGAAAAGFVGIFIPLSLCFNKNFTPENCWHAVRRMGSRVMRPKPLICSFPLLLPPGQPLSPCARAAVGSVTPPTQPEGPQGAQWPATLGLWPT